METSEKEKWLWDHGYVIMSWSTLCGLHERALAYPGKYIVLDPNDNEEGFMLRMDDMDKLIHEAWCHLSD